ncbi:MAG TPA: LPS assembly lipoprotein LptE [Steroidobacteraceae bacterium]|jgi:LPS-assembly lipoprotein|nr:LPS assembly lipoprotein LptE [Steroidobacteraceae bacterium]
MRSRSALAKLTAAGVAAAAMVTACGFHLEGHTPLPESLRTPYVETQDRQSDFVQSLQRALLSDGAHLAPDRDKASATVNILKDNLKRRVVSVSNLNQPNEYEITYTVTFSVSAGDKELLAPQDVSATRVFSFNESQLLAKGNEEDVLRTAMAHDLADMVMRRLARL